MRVLVTGGYGFIGVWTTKVLLELGHTVRIFENHDDRRLFDQLLANRADVGGIAHIRGNIVDTNAVDSAVEGCDAVVHLAGVLCAVLPR